METKRKPIDDVFREAEGPGGHRFLFPPINLQAQCGTCGESVPYETAAKRPCPGRRPISRHRGHRIVTTDAGGRTWVATCDLCHLSFRGLTLSAMGDATRPVMYMPREQESPRPGTHVELDFAVLPVCTACVHDGTWEPIPEADPRWPLSRTREDNSRISVVACSLCETSRVTVAETADGN